MFPRPPKIVTCLLLIALLSGCACQGGSDYTAGTGRRPDAAPKPTPAEVASTVFWGIAYMALSGFAGGSGQHPPATDGQSGN